MGIAQVAGGGGGPGGGGLLQVSASNVSHIGTGPTPCGYPGSTGPPGTLVSGGSGSYSFLWTLVGAAASRGPWEPSSATAQNPTWRAPRPVCESDLNPLETWKVTVTDSATGQSGNAQITVSIEWAQVGGEIP